MNAAYQSILEKSQRLLPQNAVLNDDDGWMALFGKLAPIVSRVAAFGSFINAVIGARQTAAFQEQLISSLQTIESTLEGIKSDLDAIYQELENIEKDIVALDINPSLTAIETWGSLMAALNPTDKDSAQALATAMLDAKEATNLLGCMVNIHSAMVGESISTPLIKLLDAPSFLRLRARLVQGLQLLAFATAFNTAEAYDYGTFLHQWAVNFQQQSELFFASGKDPMPIIDAGISDGLLLSLYGQPAIPNVAVTMLGTGVTMLLWCGTASAAMVGKDLLPQMLFKDVPGPCCIDLVNNEFTFDPNSPLAQRCVPDPDVRQYIIYFIKGLMGLPEDEILRSGNIACGARYNSAQTFLGSVAGQVHWLEATGSGASLISCIHDGDTVSSPLLTCNATSQALASQPFMALQSLTPALWTASWISKDVISIAALSTTNGAPNYLGIDANGQWTVSTAPVPLTVTAAPAVPRAMANSPFTVVPTAVSLQGGTGSSRTVLFHQY